MRSLLACMSTVICLLLFVACDDPSASLAPPPSAEALTILAVLDPDQPFQTVRVSSTRPERPLERLRARLYEDGRLVAIAQPVVGRDCGPEPFGQSLAHHPCLALPYWVRPGERYRLEVEAEGFSVASGETRVPSLFEITAVSAAGTPPGSEGLSLYWTPAAGVHRYLVGVRAEDAFCTGFSCDSGWLRETDRTFIEDTVDATQISEGGTDWVIDVIGTDRPLHDFLTTGAEGDVFVVPPLQNVVGGFGVVGSWVRRTIRDEAVERPLARGEWESAVFLPGLHTVLASLGADSLLVGSSEGLFVGAASGSFSHALNESITAAWRAGSEHWAISGGTLFRSSSSLLEWEETFSHPQANATAHASARDGLVLIAADAEAGSPARIFRSTDEGDTFDLLNLPVADDRQARVAAFAEDPIDGTLYVILLSRVSPDRVPLPVFRSTDRGLNWAPVGGTLPGEMLFLATGPDGRLYASPHSGVWSSTDQGASWTRIASPAFSHVLPHPSDPARLWLVDTRTQVPGAQRLGVYYSDDGGETFRPFGLEGANLSTGVVDTRGDWIYVVRVGQTGVSQGILRRRLTDS